MNRVAIVHDWFDRIAGPEKVVREIVNCFPESDVFSLTDNLCREDKAFLGVEQINTSFIQKMPFRRQLNYYLPMLPMAVEQLDLGGYDVVISSSQAVAKGVVTHSDQIHLAYIHAPLSHLWALPDERSAVGSRRSIVRSLMRHYLRMWDQSTSNRVDVYMANSGYVANRIRKLYGRDAEVVYPPVDVRRMEVGYDKEDFFLVAARLIPQNQLELVIDAMKLLPNQRMIVIGSGPERKRLKKRAGSNVQFLGFQADEVIFDYMRRAKALVMSGIENFGARAVEAQASGTPVIAPGRGGTAETVLHGETGMHFFDQTSEAIAEAIQTVADLPSGFYDVDQIRAHAETFRRECFYDRLLDLVHRSISNKNAEDAAQHQQLVSSNPLTGPVSIPFDVGLRKQVS